MTLALDSNQSKRRKSLNSKPLKIHWKITSLSFQKMNGKSHIIKKNNDRKRAMFVHALKWHDILKRVREIIDYWVKQTVFSHNTIYHINHPLVSLLTGGWFKKWLSLGYFPVLTQAMKVPYCRLGTDSYILWQLCCPCNRFFLIARRQISDFLGKHSGFLH